MSDTPRTDKVKEEFAGCDVDDMSGAYAAAIDLAAELERTLAKYTHFYCVDCDEFVRSPCVLHNCPHDRID